MGEMLRSCDRAVMSAFAIYIRVRALNAVFKDKGCDKRALCAAVLVNMTVMLLVGRYAPYIWANLLTSTFLIGMLTSCYESRMWKKAAVTVGLTGLLALSEMLVALLIGIDDLRFLAKASNGEDIALFLSQILSWAILTVVLRIVVRDDPYKLPTKAAALEITVFLLLASELTFLCVRKQGDRVVESMVLLTAEITVYLMIYLQDRLAELFASKAQARLIEQEKIYYQREAAIIRQKQELQRQFRHDLKNRLQVIKQIAEHGDLAELKDYLWEIETKHKEQEVFSCTGDLIIDSIINSKLQDAVEKGIQVEASVTLPAAVKVKTDDMVVILGDLLDNAIEACERTDTARYIKLSMGYEKSCIILHIQNSFDQVTEEEQGELVTRKKDKALHGLGLKSVKNTVKRYDGIMEVTSEGRDFSVDIILYV